jgi:hypothetical protein
VETPAVKAPKENLTVPIERKISLTLEECSALTSLAVSALRSAIWAGEIAFIRSGERKRYIIRRESLDSFLRAREEREHV